MTEYTPNVAVACVTSGAGRSLRIFSNWPPLLQRTYGVSSLAMQSSVGGSSRGGLAAVCAALRAPGRFGLVMSQSGSLWYVPGIADKTP